MNEPVEITVAINQDSHECLYNDGVAWESTGEITVYVTDLVSASDGKPILLTHLNVEIDLNKEDWPESLEDLMAFAVAE